MCRHVLHLGPAVTLASLVTEPPHSLLHQAYAPREMRGSGTVNVDGFGVGWLHQENLMRYRNDRPIWSDASFLELARVITSEAVLGAVRSATIGMPLGVAACAPFLGEGWLFSHNGRIEGWPGSVAKLAEGLPVQDVLTMEALTDSALVWALVRHRLGSGADPGHALRSVVAEVGAAAPGSRLNLLLTDGRVGFATTAGHSLAVRQAPGRVVIASEPLDADPGWVDIPDRRLLTADRSGYTMEEL
jgi:gamma-glutamyl hercynylcysteine S-oxide hydrolase